MNLINPYRFGAAGGITSPDEITGLQLWLDADDDTTIFNDDTVGSTPVNGGDVKRWEDKSTNANHFTQASATFTPKYATSVAQANGRAGVQFVGTTLVSRNYMASGNNFALNQDSKKTIFTVCRPTGTSNTDIKEGSSVWSLHASSITGAASHITTEPANRMNNVTWIGDDPAELTTNASVITIDQDTGSPSQIHDVITIWRNGNLVTRQAGANGTIVNDPTYSVIGQLGETSDPTFPFTGDIYEILVYDTQLSASDRADVEAYLTQKWGIPATTPPTKTFGLASRFFDGIDDELTITDNSGALKFTNAPTTTTDKPFTISAWVKMANSIKFRILNKFYPNVTTSPDYIFTVTASDQLTIILKDKTDGGQLRIDTTATMSQYQNTWTHMVATYDGSSNGTGLKLYIDGNLQGDTDSSSGTYTCMRGEENDLYIGALNQFSTSYSDGKIADLRVYDTDLSSTDITDLKNGVDVTTNLVGQWLGNSNSLDDYVAGSTNDGVNNGSSWNADGPFD